ncbi:MAG TPA: DUF3443 family protein [Terriglobales bacterium]|nr:DUF3443 family protein [Terriglobales bacterium]
MKCGRWLSGVAQTSLLLIGLSFLISCVGGSNTTPAGLPISITLLPSANNVSIGQAVVVTANGYDQNNGGATWTLDPVNFGALTNLTPTSVNYTAPTNFTLPTKVTITATSVTNPTIIASVQISVSPLSVALSPFAPQTINAGEQVSIFPNIQNDTTNSGVTWSMSPSSGAGSLANVSPTGATYVAPSVVTDPTTVTITASSIANPFAVASLEITALASGAGPNVAVIHVDGGPVVGQVRPNAPFTSLTICNPGSTTVCQTVDGILVDTGSYGLRILQSQIPLLKLPTLTDGSGNLLESCSSYPDGSYIWGPVSQADVNIGAETAPTALVQVITSSTVPAPNGCSNGGTNNLNTPELLGANGILGIGPEPTDCTLAGKNLCDGSVQSVPPNIYFSCPSKGCQANDSAVLVPVDKQVNNPITLFSDDNNGTLLQLPAVAGPQVKTVGTLTFGIATQANNGLGSATIYTTGRDGNFTTFFNGQTLTGSFLDSGAEALLFPGLMPICTTSVQFYCPPGPRTLSATNQGATQGSSIISFDVENADSLFATYPGRSVFGTLAGHNGTYNTCINGVGACTFDWGLPFFYGRSVYTQIDRQRPPFGAPPGPWCAY